MGYCTNCGNQLTGARFCTNCGAETDLVRVGYASFEDMLAEQQPAPEPVRPRQHTWVVVAAAVASVVLVACAVAIVVLIRGDGTGTAKPPDDTSQVTKSEQDQNSVAHVRKTVASTRSATVVATPNLSPTSAAAPTPTATVIPTPTVTVTAAPTPAVAVTAVAPVGPSAQARTQMDQAYAASRTAFAADGRWAAQLASKWVGIVDPNQVAADGSHTFGAVDIWREYSQARDRFGPEVLLLQSTDMGKQLSFPGKPDSEPMWLTVYYGSFADRASATQWCHQTFPSMAADQVVNFCFAKQAVPPYTP